MVKTKKVENEPYVIRGAWYLECVDCDMPTPVSGKEVFKVHCSRCTSNKCIGLLSEAERDKLFKGTPPKTNRPRGWAFMSSFVDKDGTVYRKGKEMPELKGTLPPTKVKKKAKPKKKVSGKLESEDQEMLRLAKVYEDKQKHKKQKGK
mgnify:FL=1|jgi:hypothetical protein